MSHIRPGEEDSARPFGTKRHFAALAPHEGVARMFCDILKYVARLIALTAESAETGEH